MTNLEPAPTSIYVDDPSEWRRLLDRTLRVCDAGGVPGLDTETIGCDPEEDNAVWRAHVAVWSLGLPDGALSPRGFRRSSGYVFPPAALEVFRSWLESAAPKVLHNRRYDQHTLANDGYELGGGQDTVDVFRVLVPGLERYGIKHLIPPFCNYEVYGDFKVIFSEPRVQETTKKVRQWVCQSHGAQEGRRKYCEVCDETLVLQESQVVSRKELKSRRLVPVHEICGLFPGTHGAGMSVIAGQHAMWPLFVNYAGLDAIGAADLYQLKDIVQGGKRVAKVLQLD